MLNGKDTKICLMARQKKKTQYQRVNIFEKRKSFRGRLKFELDLPKYATKSDLKKCNNR